MEKNKKILYIVLGIVVVAVAAVVIYTSMGGTLFQGYLTRTVDESRLVQPEAESTT